MIQYFVEVLVFQAIFLVGYEVWLKQESFFQSNRFYLLFTSIISFLLPLISLPSLATVIPQDVIVQLPAVLIQETTPQVESISTSSWSFVGLIWGLGAMGFSVLLLRKFFLLKSLRQQATLESYNGLSVYRLPSSKTAFSFLNHMYIGDDISEKDRASILEHEAVHIEQKHSYDLLIMEFLQLIMWFNPCIYRFKSNLASLHEFIADAQVIKSQSKVDYYEGLLAQTFQTHNISFTNTFFNHSLIKKRITMLHKSKSNAILKLKYVLILPLIALMLIYTSCSESKEEVQDAVIETNTTTENSKIGRDGDMPFATVERVPTFSECSGDNDALKSCVSQKITEYFLANFDNKLADELDISGVQRIYVAFKIDKTGDVQDVRARAAHKQLADEAKRVVQGLPKFIPGQQGGENVSVLYSLPVVFKIEE